MSASPNTSIGGEVDTDFSFNRVRNLSIILQDVDFSLSDYELSDQQQTHLQDISSSCQNVLSELEKTVGKYQELECKGGSLSWQMKRVWKRLKWEPEDIRELRERVTANVTLFNAFLGGISRYLRPYFSDLEFFAEFNQSDDL